MPLNLNSKDLNAVATGQGAAHDTQGFTVLSMHTQFSAGVTAGVVALQVSPDGTNWATAASRTFTASTNFVDSVTVAARYARVAVTTNLTGGTVTAWLDAAGPLVNDAGWSG